MEKWAKISGYNYSISTHSRVRNDLTGKILKNSIEGVGYLTVGLSKPGHLRRTHRIHRLKMEAFVPNPNRFKYINHKNGIKTDNRFCNLEWCSQSHNVKHAYKTGLCVPITGSRHGRSILTDCQVLQIRSQKSLKLKELAREHGVSMATISMIRNNVTWKSN